MRLRAVVLQVYVQVQARHRSVDHVDLVLRLRDLLRDVPSIRREAQQLFDHIFVDEFQDTDPLQAELIVFLAADPSRADERDWEALLEHLAPGKLFVVGDPKQSIYRFRRADIDIYNEVRGRLGGSDGRDIVALTTNFRSVPALCDWANDVFRDRFPHEPTPHAPRFAPLQPYAAPPCVAASLSSANLA